MDWYYKAALIVGLIWATARALGMYGEAQRDLDIAFLFGFMLTVGGWAAVFLIVDKVATALGWRRAAAVAEPAVDLDVRDAPSAGAAAAGAPPERSPAAGGRPAAPGSTAAVRPRRRSRR